MNNEKIAVEILESMRTMLFETYKSGLIEKIDNDGLTFFHRNILLYIVRNEGCKMKDVGDQLSISPPALTHMVEKLVEYKLIKREIKAEERRAIFLSATKQGRDMTAKYQEKQVKKIAAMLGKSKHNEKQKESIVFGLRAIIEMLQKV